jgi:hypothetical protein
MVLVTEQLAESPVELLLLLLLPHVLYDDCCRQVCVKISVAAATSRAIGNAT